MKTLAQPTKVPHREQTRALNLAQSVQRTTVPHAIQKALTEARDPKVIARKLAAIKEIKRIGKEVRKRLGIKTMQDYRKAMQSVGLDA